MIIGLIVLGLVALVFVYSLMKIGSHNHEYKCPECGSYHIKFDEKKLTYLQYKCVSCNALLAFSNNTLYKV